MSGPGPWVVQTLADLEWLLEREGSLRVLRQDGRRLVRVIVDVDAETVVVSKAVVKGSKPLESLRQAVASARRDVEEHQRRRGIRLVQGVSP